MQGPHQDAQKSTTTILPFIFSRLIGVPSTALKLKSGWSPELTTPRVGVERSTIRPIDTNSVAATCFMGYPVS